MLLKKPTIALCSSGSLSSALSLHTSAPVSITSSISPPSASTSTSTATPAAPLRPLCRIIPARPTQWRSSRQYATVRDESRGNDDDPASPNWPKSKNPTPYEIFDQAKTTPYSKKTFYQLVKLYHPDRHAHTSSSSLHGGGAGTAALSHKAKLERYRLVVAANDILSDPAKRRAYDLYGAGWGGTSDMSNTAFREADRAWRSQTGSAAHNATWEDWERWHWENNSRRDGAAGRSEPRYMSNGLFVLSICVFVLIGGWGQATRAGNHGMYLVDMQEKKDVRISEEMWRRKREKALLTREDRVENFLRSREGWDHGPINSSHMPKD
ncbi:hypothetical protein J7T55_011334 [Diaporthe amygdali]|uniref:uncharacterized protein n=1 Tax=Phomopsis amygdali TaxID=1214568 RepID=UPI0022FDF7A4|nr:uncharacterized protein J7T55_011334 [Diaporthe amygdali]KAJ0108843.1 hypothetical protein J7T55_011334 [Diaporthe amygdali]